jgi:hypothetical protein
LIFRFSGNVGNPEARHCWERDEGVRILNSTKIKNTALCVAYLDVSAIGFGGSGLRVRSEGKNGLPKKEKKSNVQ